MARQFGRPIGTGTIEKRKSKKGTYYRIRFSLGKNPKTGRYEYSPSIIVYGSKADANDAANEYRRQLLVKAGDSGAELFVSEYVDEWVARRRASNTVKSSTCDHDRQAAKHIKRFFGNVLVTDLDVATIKRTYTRISAKSLLMPGQLYRVHKKLKQILDDAEADGLIQGNPAKNKTIKVSQPPAVTRKSLDLDEAIRLRHCKHTEEDKSRFMGIVIGLATGCRKGEVLGLQWKHVHLGSNPYIRIEQQLAFKSVGYEQPKTKNSLRTITIDRDTADELKKWKTEQKSLLMTLGIKQTEKTPVITDQNGEIQASDNYTRWFTMFCVKNGFGKYIDSEGKPIAEEQFNDQGFPVDENGKPYSRSNRRPKIKKHYQGLKFHELRHTHTTLQIGNGMDFRTVSERAGHSRTSTTMDIYAHAIPANDHAAAELIGDLLKKDG